MTEEQNVTIVNGIGSTVTIPTTVDAPLSVNGENNTINITQVNTLEGDFITWTQLAGSPIVFTHVTNASQIRIDDVSGVGVIFDRETGTNYIGVFSLVSMTVLSEVAAITANTYVISMIGGSVLNQYMVYVDGILYLRIYKNGILIQSIDLSNIVGTFTGVYMSPSGKYIVIMTNARNLYVYKGNVA